MLVCDSIFKARGRCAGNADENKSCGLCTTGKTDFVHLFFFFFLIKLHTIGLSRKIRRVGNKNKLYTTPTDGVNKKDVSKEFNSIRLNSIAAETIKRSRRSQTKIIYGVISGRKKINTINGIFRSCHCGTTHRAVQRSAGEQVPEAFRVHEPAPYVMNAHFIWENLPFVNQNQLKQNRKHCSS